jgi:hypothetical protein
MKNTTKNTQKTSKLQWVMFGAIMGVLVLSFLTWNNTRFRPANRGNTGHKVEHGPKVHP